MLFFMKNTGKAAANNRVLLAKEKKLNSSGRVWVPVSTLWPWELNKLGNSKMRSGKFPVSGKSILVLCIASFLAGSIFSSRIWTQPNSEMNNDLVIPSIFNHEKLRTISRECDPKRVSLIWNFKKQVLLSWEILTYDIFFMQKLAESNSRDIMGEVKKTHQAIQ